MKAVSRSLNWVTTSQNEDIYSNAVDVEIETPRVQTSPVQDGTKEGVTRGDVLVESSTTAIRRGLQVPPCTALALASLSSALYVAFKILSVRR